MIQRLLAGLSTKKARRVRTCPHPSCGTEINFGLFACGPHWYELPTDLRSRIHRANRKGPHVVAPLYREARIVWRSGAGE